MTYPTSPVTIPHIDSSGALIIERLQDVEPIIERNKELQKEEQRSDWGRHIATIPNIILERWIIEDGINYLALPGREFAAMIKRKLRDPDWKWLRTGKL